MVNFGTVISLGVYSLATVGGTNVLTHLTRKYHNKIQETNLSVLDTLSRYLIEKMNLCLMIVTIPRFMRECGLVFSLPAAKTIDTLAYCVGDSTLLTISMLNVYKIILHKFPGLVESHDPRWLAHVSELVLFLTASFAPNLLMLCLSLSMDLPPNSSEAYLAHLTEVDTPVAAKTFFAVALLTMSIATSLAATNFREITLKKFLVVLLLVFGLLGTVVLSDILVPADTLPINVIATPAVLTAIVGGLFVNSQKKMARVQAEREEQLAVAAVRSRF